MECAPAKCKSYCTKTAAY